MLEELAVIDRPDRWEESRRRVLSARVASEFPSIFVRFADASFPALLRASDWDRADFDMWRFDCAVDDLARQPFALVVADDVERAEFPLEVLNRCQRWIGRRNRQSETALFDRLLRRHRELHDLSKPLVRADYNHAVDVWQWLLRLDAEASLALQLAALFHDVERLVSEPDCRVEHLAPDYQAFKDAHACAGAELVRDLLAAVGVDARVRERAAELIAMHERPSADAEVALLNDADGLSFFSLNSHGYADYFGPEQTKKKVTYTWDRMRPAARAKLAGVRVRADVRARIEEC